jgi:hypothetical protein
LEALVLADPHSIKQAEPKQVLSLMVRGNFDTMWLHVKEHFGTKDLNDCSIGLLPHLALVTTVGSIVQQVMRLPMKVPAFQDSDGAALSSDQVTLLLSLHANMKTLQHVCCGVHCDIIHAGDLLLNGAGDGVSQHQICLMELALSTASAVQDTLISHSMKSVLVNDNDEPTKLIHTLFFFDQWVVSAKTFLRLAGDTLLTLFKQKALDIGFGATLGLPPRSVGEDSCKFVVVQFCIRRVFF